MKAETIGRRRDKLEKEIDELAVLYNNTSIYFQPKRTAIMRKIKNRTDKLNRTIYQPEDK